MPHKLIAPPRLHVGMRNVKTALSIFICLVLYEIIGRDGVFLACTAAIICMQDSIDKTLSSARNRVIGTFIGAIIGMLVLYAQLLFRFEYTFVITAPIGVMLLILLCNAIGFNDAIIIGAVVLLAIVLQQTSQEPFLYSMNRLIDTIVGIGVAVPVNYLIKNPGRSVDTAENADKDAEIAGEDKDKDPIQ